MDKIYDIARAEGTCSLSVDDFNDLMVPLQGWMMKEKVNPVNPAKVSYCHLSFQNQPSQKSKLLRWLQFGGKSH